MRLASFFILTLVVFSSCDNRRVFEENHDFARRMWLATDTARFQFEVPVATANLYNVQFSVRNTRDYKWSNIFVNFVLADSTGQVLSSKLVSNDLFDQKTGKPFGRSGLGDIYDHRFPLLNTYSLKPGKYSVTLQQFMRVDTLYGILAAGVRVERTE
jgi:gliding motility-associated lipoprotein GldH